jgi:nicotinamidase/pyrazinamidase
MKTLFFDVDSQRDFLLPTGALYAPGAERVIPAVSALNRFAAARGITVISTADAHAENDPEFADWPPHCIVGTHGQRKPESTLLDGCVVVPNRPCIPDLAGARQVVLEKQHVDVFVTATLARVLDILGADRFVVYGVVTEVCVLLAARGLLKFGKPVTVVTDAIAALSAEGDARALEDIRARGGLLATVADVTSNYEIH